VESYIYLRSRQKFLLSKNFCLDHKLRFCHLKMAVSSIRGTLKTPFTYTYAYLTDNRTKVAQIKNDLTQKTAQVTQLQNTVSRRFVFSLSHTGSIFSSNVWRNTDISTICS
jgi:hypothetical protein